MIKKILLRIAKFGSIIFLSVVLSIGVLLAFDYFRIKTVSLNGATSLNNLSSVYRQVIFLVNSDKLQEKLLQKNPSFMSIHIEKKLPHTIIITAIKTKPIAQLQVYDGWYLLSPTAVVITKKRSKTSVLATMSYFTKYPFEAYNVGEKLDAKEIQYATYFLDRIGTIKNLKVDTIAINYLFMIVFKSEDREIWLTTKKNKEEQFGTLKTILRYFNKTGAKFKKIDLRFTKPLVTLE
ncbi:hypothetical protein A2690_02390 [Candidatus Roizmanbacteria bacterium RIFCSPHIGHO2_01_FULL_39_12b]|uniref:POTRA domain-containing protein n=1 Tax=Candidatus Roizmanbacteria bacterium RIFCSPHIGHO2_01_FULL_39_12b TaxID=1802030 RepID=A0A1F7GDP2_9BACT|nr:MAG: hypothetical protein A2690_02390 [Candidatus Roizmanbacteria bacterium RIFCSPHIGHO2_01_FULL_39_12b]OGK46652.1 MAG: hypothetical protein A3B46_00410 [Candidatus Roizmanbacteria bacterium RIFCSPLOWO2_01_FULL_39_19]